jgi:hypothetical protein
MADINVGTQHTSYPPTFNYEFDLVFTDPPDADAQSWILEAIDECSFNFASRGHFGQNGAEVTFSWHTAVEIDPDLTDSFVTFAKTDYIGISGGQHQFTVKILNDLHSRGGVFGGERFYKESIIHELGHVVITLLVVAGGSTEDGLRDSFAAMHGMDPGTALNDPSLAWEERVIEAAVESFKDVFLPSTVRAYDNRTNHRLLENQFTEYMSLIQGPHYSDPDQVRHQLSPAPSELLWQQDPIQDNNEVSLPGIVFKLAPPNTYTTDYTADTLAWMDGAYNLWLDEGKFDKFYIVGLLTGLEGWGGEFPIGPDNAYDHESTSFVPAIEIEHSFVGGSNPGNEDDACTYGPHEETVSTPAHRIWAIAGDSEDVQILTGADDGLQYWVHRVCVPPLATYCFLQWGVLASSNLHPNNETHQAAWGKWAPYVLLPAPGYPGYSFAGTIELGTARQGRTKSRRRIRGGR